MSTTAIAGTASDHGRSGGHEAQPPASAASRPQLALLQAGRGVAALLVVLFHAAGAIFAAPAYWNVAVDRGLFRFGHEGVAFFFVLSGFIILHAHLRDIGRPARLPAYIVKRLARIYLPYWIVLAAVVALYLLKPALGRPDITAPWIMLNSPLLIGMTNSSTLPVAWTLFHEMLFYALFAVIIVDRRIGGALLGAWFVACALVLAFGWGDRVHYGLMPINLLFGMGLAARWWLSRERPVAAPLTLMWAGIAAFVLLGLTLDYSRLIPHDLSSILFGLASTAFVIGGVTAERQGRVTAPAALKQLGDASYSLYLTHFPALSVFAKLFMAVGVLRALPAPVSFVLIVAGCIAVAIAFHKLVEKPLVRRVGRLLPGGRGR